MQRDLQRLATATFHAIVAGGGVYGLTIAHELARRGMPAGLVGRAALLDDAHQKAVTVRQTDGATEAAGDRGRAGARSRHSS